MWEFTHSPPSLVRWEAEHPLETLPVPSGRISSALYKLSHSAIWAITHLLASDLSSLTSLRVPLLTLPLSSLHICGAPTVYYGLQQMPENKYCLISFFKKFLLQFRGVIFDGISYVHPFLNRIKAAEWKKLRVYSAIFTSSSVCIPGILCSLGCKLGAISMFYQISSPIFLYQTSLLFLFYLTGESDGDSTLPSIMAYVRFILWRLDVLSL